jgi:hypothetical protein
MTLPASPPITLKQIQTEFGGPGNLISYYAGGGFVPASTANGTGHAIPSSGAIDLFDFLGASAFVGPIVYNSNGLTGAQSNVVPSGATVACIEICAGGGGGSNCANTLAPALFSYGPGGGSGYATINVSVTGGQTFNFVIGTGGLGGHTAGAAGADGTITTLTGPGSLSMNALPGKGATVTGSGSTQTTTVGAAGTANGSTGVLTAAGSVGTTSSSGAGGTFNVTGPGRSMGVDAGRGGQNSSGPTTDDARGFGCGGGGEDAFGGGFTRAGNGSTGGVIITYR